VVEEVSRNVPLGKFHWRRMNKLFRRSILDVVVLCLAVLFMVVMMYADSSLTWKDLDQFLYRLLAPKIVTSNTTVL
jgi:hypothetical protein